MAQVKAPALGTTDAVVRARSRQVLGLAPALQAVVDAKKTHERALKKLLGRHPDGGLFLALPGAGVPPAAAGTRAAALLGELSEDRTTLPSAADLQAAPTPAGRPWTAPVTVQSGKSRRHPRRGYPAPPRLQCPSARSADSIRALQPHARRAWGRAAGTRWRVLGQGSLCRAAPGRGYGAASLPRPRQSLGNDPLGHVDSPRGLRPRALRKGSRGASAAQGELSTTASTHSPSSACTLVGGTPSPARGPIAPLRTALGRAGRPTVASVSRARSGEADP